MNEKSVFQLGDSEEEKVGRFVAGSSLALMASVITGALLFLWNVVMQRLLGPEGFGLARPFVDVWQIAYVVIAFGLPETMMTFISREHRANPGASVRVMRDGTRLLFILAAAVFAPLAGAALIFREQFSPLMWGFAWLLILATVGRQMYFSMYSTLSGIQRLDLVAVCNIFFPLTAIAGSTAMILLVRRMGIKGEHAGVLAAVSGVSIGAALQYFFSLYVGRKNRVDLRGVYSWREWRGGEKKMLAFGWKAWVAVMARTFFSFIPPAAVTYMAHRHGAFGPTPEINAVQAGYFSSAFTYAMATLLVVGMILALLPAVSEAQRQGDQSLLQRYYDLAVKYAFTITMFVLAAYSALAGPIVEFFSGPEFPAEKVGAMAFILAIGVGASVFITLLTNLLIGMERPGVPAVASATVLALVAVALPVSAKLFGTVIAMAAGFTGTILLGTVAMVIYVSVAVGLKWKWILPARPAAAAVVTAIALQFLPSSIPLFLFSLAAAAPVYFCTLGFLGGMDSEDFDMVRGMLGSLKLGFLSRILDTVEKLFSLSPLYKRK